MSDGGIIIFSICWVWGGVYVGIVLFCILLYDYRILISLLNYESKYKEINRCKV